MAMRGSVSILYSGCDSEVEFIKYLERCNAGQSYRFEYTKYQERQTKEVIMLNDAVRYKKEKTPLIVLISKPFFERIWLTSHKQGILNVISNFSSKNCLHIWLDVTEDYVRYRSKALLRTDGHFRKIKASELKMLNQSDVIPKMQELINAHGETSFSLLNNYAVDDEEEEMRRNFERLNLGASHAGATYKEPESVPMSTPKKNNKDIYKQALRYASMTEEEMEAELSAGQSQRVSQNAQNNQNANARKKKRSGKKKGDTSSIKLLTDISEKDKKQIAVYLDTGSGANWKQLAQTFDLDASVIRGLANCPPHISQTERLIEMLRADRPDLELLEFIQKCKQILRTDVPAYILHNVLN